MKIVKCSEFLKRNDIKPFLLGAFFSRTIISENQKYFFTTSAFRRSKYVFDDDFDFDKYKKDYINILNNFSGYKNWQNKNNIKLDTKLPFADHLFILENDLNISITIFFRNIMNKLLTSSWVLENGLTEEKKQFLRGFMELRGSIDTSHNFISQDYFYNTKREISKITFIFDQLDLPTKYANINFRELQNQYINNAKRRNTQFRFNLNWYANTIGFTNAYKAKIFENAYHFSKSYIKNNIYYYDTPLSHKKDENSFTRYINFFSQNIYGNNLSKQDIAISRKILGFENQPCNTTHRNSKIINTFKIISPDECAICGTKETYTNAKTGRQHFDIHHMISLANDKELDSMGNLIKLCNNCHSKMKKGSGLKADQLLSIRKILLNQENVLEFCSNYLNTDDLDILTCKIQSMLK